MFTNDLVVCKQLLKKFRSYSDTMHVSESVTLIESVLPFFLFFFLYHRHCVDYSRTPIRLTMAIPILQLKAFWIIAKANRCPYYADT